MYKIKCAEEEEEEEGGAKKKKEQQQQRQQQHQQQQGDRASQKQSRNTKDFNNTANLVAGHARRNNSQQCV